MEQKEILLNSPRQVISMIEMHIKQQKELLALLESQLADFKRIVNPQIDGEDFRSAPVSDIKVEEGMKVRVFKVFHSLKACTIGDVLRMGKLKFIQTHNVGRKTIVVIERALEEQYGVSWPYYGEENSDQE